MAAAAFTERRVGQMIEGAVYENSAQDPHSQLNHDILPLVLNLTYKSSMILRSPSKHINGSRMCD